MKAQEKQNFSWSGETKERYKDIMEQNIKEQKSNKQNGGEQKSNKQNDGEQKSNKQNDGEQKNNKHSITEQERGTVCAKKRSGEISTLRAIGGILLSILMLAVAQSLAFLLSGLFLAVGLPVFVCNIIAGILNVLFTLAGTAVICKKYLKMSMTEMRIPQIRLKKVWLLSAVLMPLLAVALAVLSGGHWEKQTFEVGTTLAIVIGAVVFYGLSAGIAEEIVFRGLIMGCLEQRFGIKVAVLVPSVLFGVTHIIMIDLDVISIIQLLIAGSIVGILFSLIAVESGSVWNSAIVHGFWNMVMTGGILHIGNTADTEVIFNFSMKNKSFLLSGGAFGFEASVICILVYTLFIGAAVLLIRKRRSAELG